MKMLWQPGDISRAICDLGDHGLIPGPEKGAELIS
jgi:hypothetical protein